MKFPPFRTALERRRASDSGSKFELDVLEPPYVR